MKVRNSPNYQDITLSNMNVRKENEIKYELHFWFPIRKLFSWRKLLYLFCLTRPPYTEYLIIWLNNIFILEFISVPVDFQGKSYFNHIINHCFVLYFRNFVWSSDFNFKVFQLFYLWRHTFLLHKLKCVVL